MIEAKDRERGWGDKKMEHKKEEPIRSKQGPLHSMYERQQMQKLAGKQCLLRQFSVSLSAESETTSMEGGSVHFYSLCQSRAFISPNN